MEEPKDMLLADALECSIQAHYKLIKYRRAVIVLTIICIGLAVGYFL